MSHKAFDFDCAFRALTGHSPLPWQSALFTQFINTDPLNRFPPVCDLPTGLGKTSVIPIWLLALAYHASEGTAREFPRRLVYVVNRRTVVDQSTREVELVRRRLEGKEQFESLETAALSHIAKLLRSLGSNVFPEDSPVAISTLRGQFADNAEWRDDPSRPAVIAGTVDMIGSRLLFSGYGRGFKSKPLHAAFLGQDVLLVHDEAHLEPAFQKLIESIHRDQRTSKDFKCFHVMALSATARSDQQCFSLGPDDFKNQTVQDRIHAKKGIKIHSVDNEKSLADKIYTLATRNELVESGAAILIYLQRVDDVNKVVERLRKDKHRVDVLTGTLRGLERDNQVKTPIFARFLPNQDETVAPADGTVYLVCTSAGEVGVNISSDHLVCDLTPFDSMSQRLGRVNRFGRGTALVDIIISKSSDGSLLLPKKVPEGLRRSLERTLVILERLPLLPDGRHDASPAALRSVPYEDRREAFSPAPVILDTSDILFDAWSLTTIRHNLPGRPPVADWLHGVSEGDPPETQVAWREEVERLDDDALLEQYPPEDLLEDYPLKPHELLRDRSSRVLGELELLTKRNPEARVWIVNESGKVSVHSLGEIANRGEIAISNKILLLPPLIGGLNGGQLNGLAEHDSGINYDVSDRWLDEHSNQQRLRIVEDLESSERISGMRLLRTINLRAGRDDLDESDDSTGKSIWRWHVRPRSADDDGSRTATRAEELDKHLATTEKFAALLVNQLLDDPEAAAIRLAAKWHDLGKARRKWQLSIGNRDPSRVLAKSGPEMRPLDVAPNYRHELGSLLDIRIKSELAQLSPQIQDLVLHLVAAHHGRGRPHFPDEECLDPEHNEGEVGSMVTEVPRRFARLQRIYGRWGLAYLESLMRAADILATQSIQVDAASDIAPRSQLP